MSDPSDVELARKLSSRDKRVRESAFALLFERHRRRAFDLAWRVLGDAELAADAVQEAFLTVYRKGGRFEARSQFSSWLYRVVLNQSIDLRRRERRHRVVPLEHLAAAQAGAAARHAAGESEPALEPQAVGGSPETEALRSEQADAVREAIARLSPKLAAVIVLRYPRGLSYEEIGEILELPPGTVRSRLNRAHAALRALLSDRLDSR
jgi:RNA polymerase sigma-70 factor, ECF subfamily